MPDWNAIAEQLREVQQAHGRFLGQYAMQCLWDRGVQRLERALATIGASGSPGDAEDGGSGSRD